MPNIEITSNNFQRTVAELKAAFGDMLELQETPTAAEKENEMTNVQKFMDKEVETLVVGNPVPHDPMFLNTAWGAVAVYGHELVSKKDLVILGACLNLPDFTPEPEPDSNITDHCVRSVVFRDSELIVNKNPVCGTACPDCGGIAISLEKISRDAIEDAKSNLNVSVWASFHRGLITTLLHEIHHIATMPYLPADAIELEKAEADAVTWSTDTLFYLAKNVDIEPAHHAECSFLSRVLDTMKGLDEWLEHQKFMHDNHIFYDCPETEEKKRQTFHKFKAYMQLTAVDYQDYEAWGKPTIPGAVEAVSPLQEALKAVSPPDPQPIMHPKSAMPNLFFQEYSEVVNADLEEPDFEGACHDHTGMTLGNFPAAANPSVPLFQPAATPGNVPAPTFSGFPVASAPAVQVSAPAVAQPAVNPAEDRITAIVTGVYMKCYNHIFTHCGRLLNSDLGFSNPTVVRSMGIQLAPEEMQVVVKMDCQDANGRWCPTMSTSGGLLFGQVTKSNLPQYKLYINCGNGVEVQRLLLPQNPATRKSNGEYKDTAMAARNGSAMMWIKDADDAAVKAGAKLWRYKIIDGVISEA